VTDGTLLFPNRNDTATTRSTAAQRLMLHVEAAAVSSPRLLGRSNSPPSIRHTTPMHLLQSGVEMAVIALWLGDESPATTHLYLGSTSGPIWPARSAPCGGCSPRAPASCGASRRTG
jgi:site-specific recombinase XerD